MCARQGREEAHTVSLKRALVLKAMAGADDPDTHAVALQKWEVLKADPSSDGTVAKAKEEEEAEEVDSVWRSVTRQRNNI